MSNTEGSRRVVWDEDNLEKNAEYQRQHPVTMHIDEPKTPYVHIEDEDAEAQDRGEELSWDPKANAVARQVKEKVASEGPSGPAAPVSKSGRPMLHPETATGELEAKQQERQFREMRKAVYADEGANFRALLAKRHDDDEDEDDDEEGVFAKPQAVAKEAEVESLVEKQKRFKAKGEAAHMRRMSEGVERHGSVETPSQPPKEPQKPKAPQKQEK